MRVAVLHNLSAGGAHRRMSEQVTGLEHLGASVIEVTTATANPVTRRPLVVPLTPLAFRVSSVLRPPLRYRDLHELRCAWAHMGQLALAAGADVIFANPDRWLKGAVDCDQGRLPVVRFCDEPRRIDHEPELAATLNRATRWLYTDLRRREAMTDQRAIARSAMLLTNSQYTASRILRSYGRDAAVVPSGVSAAMTAGAGGAHHLLSVGSLLATKGHALAIEAAALSELALPVVIVAHSADRAEQERLSTLANHVGVNIQFRLGITDDELAQLYRDAFALLYMAEREPLGLASLEAQACGCPVVVANEGGLPETVGPSGGLVVPRTADAASQALRRLVKEPRPTGRADRHSGSWSESARLLLRELQRHVLSPMQFTDLSPGEIDITDEAAGHVKSGRLA